MRQKRTNDPEGMRRHQVAEAGGVIAARLERFFRHVEHTAAHALRVIGAFLALRSRPGCNLS